MHRPGTRDAFQKGDLLESFTSSFSLQVGMPILHEILTNMTSVSMNLLFTVLCRQSFQWERTEKSQGVPDPSSSCYFPLHPPQQVFICPILLPIILDFPGVNPATPIAPCRLFLNRRYVLGIARPQNCPPAPS